MKLYLHIGTEKTGSSFLQTVLANNRPLLEGNAIYFPKAGNREKDMKSGLISPGNGKDLLMALQEENLSNIISLFKAYRKEASIQKCDKILISNENLIKVLHDSNKLKLLKNCCELTKTELVSSILFIRNPIEQVISLYQHRAKNGDIDNFKEWLINDYELPLILKKFIPQLKNNNLKVQVHHYKKDSNYLIEVFFKYWLNMSSIPRWEEKVVNPSLNFSELILLSQLKKNNPNYVYFFYSKFIKIPYKQKSEEKEIKESISNFLNSYLYQFNETWLAVENILISKDGFIKPTNDNQAFKEISELTFSKEQINNYTEFLLETTTIKFKIQLTLFKLKNYFGKIKQHIIG